MKNIANILFTVVLLTSIAFQAKAQAVDMALLNPSISPQSLGFPGTATLNFTIVAEILDQPLSSDDLGISIATVNISLSNLQGSAAILPTGAGADLFNWQYNALQNVYIGTSKDVLLAADVPLAITLSNLPVVQATTSNITGFLANLTPPGDLLASESNDDAVSFYRPSPLPVTLVSFAAIAEGKVSVLDWATTEETNSDAFEIEHSVNGKQWNKIGKVKSHTDSKTLQKYSFTHKEPVNGENLYRLKMVDLDATFAYSRIQGVKMDGLASDLSIYPNPIAEKMFVRDFEQVKSVVINDLNGRTVLQSGATTTGAIDVKNLSAGMYVVRISRSNGVTSSQKILISK